MLSRLLLPFADCEIRAAMVRACWERVKGRDIRCAADLKHSNSGGLQLIFYRLDCDHCSFDKERQSGVGVLAGRQCDPVFVLDCGRWGCVGKGDRRHTWQ